MLEAAPTAKTRLSFCRIERRRDASLSALALDLMAAFSSSNATKNKANKVERVKERPFIESPSISNISV